MGTADVFKISEDELESHVAKKLDTAFQGQTGITLHVIDPKSTFSIQEARAQIRICQDIDSVLSVINKPVMEYPELVMLGTLDDAIEAAATYGETRLDGIEDQPARWDETPGFESACHLRQIIEAVAREGCATEGELITLNATMGADPTVVVARTPEWRVAIEDLTDNHFPARVFATLDSLRNLLS